MFKENSDFQNGYELGLKHAKEYCEAYLKSSNLSTVKKSVDNTKEKNSKTTQDIQDEEFNFFMNYLCRNLDKINVLPNYKGTKQLETNELEKKFIRYYLHKRKSKQNVFPVLKMRAGGMTTILQEIAFKEYLLGKKVLYVSPRHELTRLAKNVFSYKESVSQYVPMTGAKIDCATVSGDNYHIGFSCATISKRYDLIIVDEISLDTDLLNVLKVVGDYCQYIMKGDCKAFVAFTPRQYKNELKNESIRKALEEYEFDGNLFRYSELTGTQLKRLKDSLTYLFYTDDEETEDFWTNEPVLQQIKECLGIL